MGHILRKKWSPHTPDSRRVCFKNEVETQNNNQGKNDYLHHDEEIIRPFCFFNPKQKQGCYE